MEQIGRKELVRILRKATEGLSLREAGEKVGVSHAFVDDILKGRRYPGPKILKYLGYEQVPVEPMYAPRKYRRSKNG